MSVPIVEAKETGRIEAFSDGVFAIAVTLLVLELKVPQLAEHAGSGELWSALLSRWPSYAAYLVSFMTILIVWVNHHRLFTIIQRSDSRFLFINGLLLLVVTTIPFPTALLAEFFEKPSATVAHLKPAGFIPTHDSAVVYSGSSQQGGRRGRGRVLCSAEALRLQLRCTLPVS